jgi:hypothetical protein
MRASLLASAIASRLLKSNSGMASAPGCPLGVQQCAIGMIDPQ